MKEDKPLVSIIIPTYNQAQYLSQSIESALRQSYTNIEIIVVNDGSTDETSKILDTYIDKITLITKKNEGASKALNDGIRASKGTFVCWLSSDDIFLKNKVLRQMELISKNSEIDVVYTDYEEINEKSETTSIYRSPFYPKKSDFIYQLLRGNFINGSSVLVRKSCFSKIGFFDEELKAHVDADMWFRLLKYFNFGHVPEILIKYRWHEKNMSHNKKMMLKYRKLHYSKLLKIYTVKELAAPLYHEDEKKYLLQVSQIFLKDRAIYLAAKLTLTSLKEHPFYLPNYFQLLRIGVFSYYVLITSFVPEKFKISLKH